MPKKGEARTKLEIRKMVVGRLESGLPRLLFKHEQELTAYKKKLELAKELLKQAEAEEAAKQKDQK